MTKVTTGIIIFSRMDSNRLPGKALLDISGRPMIGRVIDRSKCIKGADHVIVATSSREIDDPIASFAEAENVSVFRGSADDVGERALGACDKFGLTKFARICGDRPFFSPSVISHLISIHNEPNIDISTTMFPRTYPPGLTGEVLSTSALRKAMLETNEVTDHEHITAYFYKHPNKFTICNLDSPDYLDLDGLSLVVDTESDLERARWIASRLHDFPDKSNDLVEVVRLAREWEHLQ